ncbi:mannitol dehydrogenase family protein [Arcanobacterium haemolyticum]|nr:mannitol dehydrogenase family protein [Arcanobacterium haemolyticum]
MTSEATAATTPSDADDTRTSRPVSAPTSSPAPTANLIGAPASDNIGIVHLGIGNFHRGHLAVYTAKAIAATGDDSWGIHGFAMRKHDIVDALAAQHGRYSILELSSEGTRADLVDVHRKFDVAAEHPERFVEAVAKPSCRILTITVSELGYHYSPTTGHLDLDDAAIQADLDNPATPTTPVGLIAAALRARAATGEPFTVLSCDNVHACGDMTHTVVTEFLRAQGADDSVLTYIEEHVGFPNAMVDRIVPTTTPETAPSVEKLIGFRDGAPVRAEKFTMWVLEDKFPGGRPAWEKVGAIFTDEVQRYEDIKLRLVNGTHSLMAYLGGLDGKETIPDAWATPYIKEAVLSAIHDDYIPSITRPRGWEPEPYVRDLDSRWRNFPLADSTSRIGCLGAARLRQRVPVPIAFHTARGRMPHALALTVAAWIAAIIPPEGFHPGPVCALMKDPAAAELRPLVEGVSHYTDYAKRILASGILSESIATNDEFVARVGELLAILVTAGVEAAARNVIEANKIH